MKACSKLSMTSRNWIEVQIDNEKLDPSVLSTPALEGVIEKVAVKVTKQSVIKSVPMSGSN